MGDELQQLAATVSGCRLCVNELPLGPRPIVQVDRNARILVAGQAPGIRVHESGVPFDDPSGDRLRDWMGVDRDAFYDPTKIAILPMGFCYPGKGKSGDLPPIPLCAKTWREQLLKQLKEIRLTLLIGQYAQNWHLEETEKSLTATVKAWENYEPQIMPLPHPSPRNNIWLKRNPWFEELLVPALRRRVARVIFKTSI
ncbi:MAG: uracil-DNA glycosylase family protein [Candidatus Thiodiazotropha sp. (ex Dulcina madagascariensis)]|nr:uracil-DNA glycosylase family protein [Candidatus Thiodiazotropha sp. (ex Dulcina madagascariensis)]